MEALGKFLFEGGNLNFVIYKSSAWFPLKVYADSDLHFSSPHFDSRSIPFLLPSSERVNSVVATRKRLKELQAEYERVHRELEETVNEAGRMSAKLRNTLAYNK